VMSRYKVVSECIVGDRRVYPGEFVNPGPDQASRLLKAGCLIMAEESSPGKTTEPEKLKGKGKK